MKNIFFVLPVFIFFGFIGTAQASDQITEAFGVNLHLHQRVLTENQEQVLTLAQDHGVQWAREEFIWQDIEPQENEFSWTAYDAVVDNYQKNNIKILGLLTYSTQWASTNPDAANYEFYPPDIEKWKNYVTAVSEHYAQDIDAWEIWNEPNLTGFWQGDVDRYVELLEVSARAIHEVYPQARIVLGGLSGSDQDFLNEVYAKISDPGLIDAVAFHPYRELNGQFVYAPEYTRPGLNTLRQDIYQMKAVMNAYHQNATPIWLTEVGWSTSDEGVSQAVQANYLLRLYTIALSIAGVEKVFWYSFADDPQKFGLVDDQYVPKLALSAYLFAYQHLNQQKFTQATAPHQILLDDFTTSQGWQFIGNACSTGKVNDHWHGKMKIIYQFNQTENCYAQIVFNKVLPKKSRVLFFRLKGVNQQAIMRLRLVDAQGEVFQYDFGSTPREWLDYEVDLKNYAAHWGKNADGVLNRPLTLESVIIDSNHDLDQAKILLDSLQVSLSSAKIYHFVYNQQDFYAVWNSGTSAIAKIKLKNKRINIDRLAKESLLKSSVHRIFTLRLNETLKFLQPAL
ncbi:MAG: hypothetical protein A2233_02655 [Candidatus Kerfeldbacteria bacterium RIFOXYA2_FULL_38_24]|uniref:Glycosyl hydrolases family 39 N-terminal catalytic domain-containing protein n=1 Tax=Candidatus Kerfeldbacteria bacterium RIFOXYB2_FULL_38_14 TaxID=1798547 RepID=A0A1G2BGM2_9BACT|nr:MAG: hypothetical protein A2233_02655 [Candidatus Kerfeldbacteria bacterium RIFOXYA2_FULL_38_24]OGY88331.1 MAG: hypothetical protein A2319_03365 [Candidatus Kerfeldbacteria bacterium RIFOXYB2_FULL_38_14]OGY89318.1 MAG: hypothetical protein A2458_05190 [Candidatus Kerfeldbacteria bacterium RIFOXYC2_FULL_38_9]